MDKIFDVYSKDHCLECKRVLDVLRKHQDEKKYQIRVYKLGQDYTVNDLVKMCKSPPKSLPVVFCNHKQVSSDPDILRVLVSK